MHLTYRDDDVGCAEQASADGIEARPGMLEAGVDKMMDLPELLGPSKEELKEAPRDPFVAVLRARRESRDVNDPRQF